MNRLRAGTILAIPSADEAAVTPAPEATRTVRMQAVDWRSYQNRVARAAPVAEEAGGRVAAGKIGTTVEEKAPAAAPGRDQLRVSREAGQGKGAVAAPASEEVVARDKALKEAQTRITELEKTLKDLQRAIELKGQTGAQLQAQAEAAKGKAPEPAKAEPPKAVAPAPAPAPEAKAPEPPKAVEPAKAPEPAAAPAKPAEPPKAVAPAKPAEPPKAAAPKADLAKAGAKGEPSFIDDLVGSTPAWAIGGGALAVLVGLMALIAARRRKTVKFEDSIIGGTDIKTNTVFGSTGGGVVNTGENSLATDFSREGIGNIDTDEVDPIAEAEVYLAYGRDAQAEEILKDALKKDPQRQEIYLKLLEIHAQHNKPSAFETVAAELYSVSQGKGDVWQKAVALGRQLDPNNPMFGEGGGAAAAAAAGAGAALVAGAAHALTPSPEAKTEPPRAAGGGASTTIAREMEGEGDNALDFRFDQDVSITRTPKTTKAQMDLIDAAEREFEESAKRAAAPANRAPLRERRRRRQLGAVGSGQAPSAGDFEFHLDEAEKPAPLQKPAATHGPRRGRLRFAGTGAAAGGDRSRQARPVVRRDARDVRGSDALGPRRTVARRRDQARPRQGVPGNGRCRRRARDPAGSAARRRRRAEGRGAVAAGEARLTLTDPMHAGGGAGFRRPFPLGPVDAKCASLSGSSTAESRMPAGNRSATGAACRTRSSGRSPRSPARTFARSPRAVPTPACTRRCRSCTSTPTPCAPTRRGCAASMRIFRPTSRCCGRSCVAREFHARYAAIARRYTYVLQSGAVRPALLAGRVGWYHRPLDVAAMTEAGSALVGTHDFSAFRAAECQAKSPSRTLHGMAIAASGEHVRFDFCANAFLHHMIRNIVGALVYVGAGKHPPSWIGELLEGRDRTRAAPTFAPDGLYFTGVDYAAQWDLPPTRRPVVLPSA